MVFDFTFINWYEYCTGYVDTSSWLVLKPRGYDTSDREFCRRLQYQATLVDDRNSCISIRGIDNILQYDSTRNVVRITVIASQDNAVAIHHQSRVLVAWCGGRRQDASLHAFLYDACMHACMHALGTHACML